MVNNKDSPLFNIVSWENKMYRILGATRFDCLKESLVWAPIYPAILHHITGKLVADLSGQLIGPILKVWLLSIHQTYIPWQWDDHAILKHPASVTHDVAWFPRRMDISVLRTSTQKLSVVQNTIFIQKFLNQWNEKVAVWVYWYSLMHLHSSEYK
jgi:hypothetical protein